MRQLNSYTFTTLNGYYKGLNEDISWHVHGAEEADFSKESVKPRNSLLLGRRTYEMMYSFWASEMAAQQMPEIAAGMNESHKYVFSKELDKAEWVNSTLVKEDMTGFVANLKRSEGPDLTILGSGEILTQLSDAGLVDRYDIMLDPVLIGSGTTLFDGLLNKQNLKFISHKVFGTGVILVSYEKW